MNWIRLGILAVALSALFVVSASATAYGTGTVENGPLRFRSGPGTSYAILGEADAGKTVIVLSAAADGWCYVSFNGAEGYMWADYLSVTMPVPQEKNAVVQSGILNLRAGPSTSYDILAAAKQGEAVTLLAGPDNGWYKVCYQGTVGYMSASYLSGGEVAASGEEDLGSGTVNVGALNMRSGPGTDYGRVLILYQGATVELLSLDNGWYKISYNGTVGYVSSVYITPGKAAEPGDTNVAAQAVSLAKTYLGVRYVYGGSSPSGFDCSGFSQYIYRQLGYSINRTASTQFNNDGSAVSKANLQVGDLVFFRAPDSSKSATHVGIYIGDNQFIHASSTGRKVMISEFNNWYGSIFVGGRRIV
jgi:cell wall-associated NlpC family hydrolase